MNWKACIFALGFVSLFALQGYLNIKESKISCEDTISVLKQTIEVKNITNQTLEEMIRVRDSIIYVQDSTIVALQIK